MPRLTLPVTEPGTPLRLTRAGWIVAGIGIALLLLPLLYFPIGPDQGAFFISAQRILRGAVYYHDVIDVKPPAIHYLYAGVIALFGPREGSIALFDFLLQCATCWLMIALVRKVSGDDRLAILYAALYVILYVGMNFQNIAQPESFTGLISLAMVRLLLYRRTPIGYLLIGALGGLLFLLKFTLGIVLAGVLLAEIAVFGTSWRSLLRSLSVCAVGFLAVASLAVLYPVAFHVWPEFMAMRRFTAEYARLQWAHPAAMLKTIMKQIPERASENYSILLLLATAVGVGTVLRPPRPDRPKMWQLTGICVSMMLMLLLSVCIEGRFYLYHFGRIYPFGAILSAIGLAALVRKARAISLRPPYALFLALATLAGAILYGPFFHYLWWSVPMAARITSGEAGFDRYYGRLPDGLSRTELKTIGGYVREHAAPGDRLFVAGNVAGMVYYHAGQLPDLPILFSPSVAMGSAPLGWRNMTVDYIAAKRPRFIVTQRDDGREDQTGLTISSDGLFRSLPGISDILREHYVLRATTTVFDLYERSSDIAAPPAQPEISR
ncbi:MAG: glycosyltransferase family 39 protein [Candidatus Kapaibacterium sp.]